MAPPNSELVAMAVRLAKEALKSRYDKANGPLKPLGVRQKASLRDRGPPDSLWSIPVAYPSPSEDSVRKSVLEAVIALGKPGLQAPPLDMTAVRAEWVGVKRASGSNPDQSPRQQLAALTTEARTKGTIIYVHGGAFFQNGLGSSRPSAARLSEESGAPVIVLDYRLAPQHAFPSQILDLLILYLSLIYPPAGSIHDPVRPDSIVLAGESAGACISLGFLQTLLHLQNHDVQFNGNRVRVPMPAGFTTVSNQGDQALCLPSWKTNSQFDIWDDKAPFLEPDFPADDVWPSDPPREDVYTDASLLSHPMVSPCTATSWTGSPPLWFAVGQERLADSSKVIAQAAHRNGVCVLWDQYEAMPHCWMFFMAKLPHAKHLWKRWGKACSDMILSSPSESRGTWIEVEQLRESPVAVGDLVPLAPERAASMIETAAMLRPIFYGKRLASQL